MGEEDHSEELFKVKFSSQLESFNPSSVLLLERKESLNQNSKMYDPSSTAYTKTMSKSTSVPKKSKKKKKETKRKLLKPNVYFEVYSNFCLIIFIWIS